MTLIKKTACSTVFPLIFAHLILLWNPGPAYSSLKTAARPPVVILGIPQEVTPLVASLERRISRRISGHTLFLGEIAGTPVVVGVSGIGKVNSASLATFLIEHYHPRAILFTGTSGALNPDLQPGDLVIGAKTVQHDFGKLTSGKFEHWKTTDLVTGQSNPLFFPADTQLLKAAMEAAAHIKLKEVDLGSARRTPRIIEGVIATGDTFVADAGKVTQIRRELGADAVEMEGAAVAQVCWEEKIPCLIIRSISDRANGDAPHDYPRFIQLASRNSAALVRQVVVEWGRSKRKPQRTT